MNKSIIIIFLFSVLISCSKSEDSLINPDGITDHEITSHSNNRVSSLLMTKVSIEIGLIMMNSEIQREENL